MGSIYKITNKVNGKVYIGKTIVSLEHRMKFHIIYAKNLSSQKYLYKSMRKHGIENFRIEQIDKCETLSELNEKEKYWINYYQSRDCLKGYNVALGGDGGNTGGKNKGKHWSETTRKQISETLKYKYSINEIPSCKGRILSEETKIKIRQARKKQIITKESSQKTIDTRKRKALERGYYHSESTKQRIGQKNSLALKKYFSNPENRKRLSERMKGMKRTPETIEKFKITMLNKKHSIEATQ